MHLKELVSLQTEFDKRHSSSEPFFIPITSANPRDLEHLVVCMLGELGEFSNILKKIVRGDLPYEEAEQDLHEELTDVFIYLIKVAGQSGVDLEARFLEKLKKNEIRFAKWSNK